MHRHSQLLKRKLSEGLRSGDLSQLVSDKITIDQYKSKMGRDEDVAVIAFRVEDKFPAIDLMEFIEKGYPDILDADMSAGEESTGDYAVFVELERNDKLPKVLLDLLQGVGQLCDIKTWKFKFFKDVMSLDATEDNIQQYIPLTAEDYNLRVKEQGKADISSVLDQGATTVDELDENSVATIVKPFASPLKLKIEHIGTYDELKDQIPGGIQLDESSRGQVLFLEKYLGNYEIYKINEKFLIRNGNKALICSKKDW